MLSQFVFSLTEGITPVTLDFSDALTTALGSISGDFGKYALIAIPVGLAIWGAPKAVRLVMKFFSALTH